MRPRPASSADGDPTAALIRNRLLALIAALLVVAGLKWSYPVTMPVAAAVFVMATAWPIKPWLDRFLPSVLSYLMTVLVLLAIFSAFIATLYFAVDQVVQTFTREQDSIRSLIDRYLAFADQHGLPTFDGEESYSRLVGIAQALLVDAYTVLGYLGLIAIIVILGLPEVSSFGRRLGEWQDGRGRRETFAALREISDKFRQYVGLTMVTSLLSGLGSGLFAYAVGLELALVWGVLNFLMNFVPVVGNIVGIVPPTLYALFQFQSWTMPMIVFVGFTVILITISNFIYPELQGRGMSLPAAAIIVSLTFWGWIWGAVGALLAVPLTIAFVIACQHFRSTEWVAKLLLRKE